MSAIYNYVVRELNKAFHYPHETYKTDSDRDGKSYTATFESKTFSQGASRYAFKGTLKGNGPRNGDDCVIKVFKSEFAMHITRWVPDLAASTKALEFANRFNSECIPGLNRYANDKYKEIYFVSPLITTIKNVSHYKLSRFYEFCHDTSLVRRNEYVTIEPFLKGKYTKFNSNFGYEDNNNPLLHTFSHWTWINSNEEFMVCDLQGVVYEHTWKFVLTDPAVHSWDRRYGITDLGRAGMERVLEKHNCNDLCRALELDNPYVGLGNGNVRLNTKYRFQLSTEEQRLA